MENTQLTQVNNHVTDGGGEGKHTPQVGDHYISRRGEDIILLTERVENGFRYSIMQSDGTFTPGKWDGGVKRDDSLNEYYRHMPNYNELAVLADRLIQGKLELDTEKEPLNTTALTASNDVKTLVSMQETFELKKTRADRIIAIAEAKVRTIRSAMEEKCRALKEYSDGLQKQIGRIREALSLIDLYTGKTITVERLKEGAAAPADEVFCVRQQLLYMDEECKITLDDGIDATDIPQFVEWLLADQKHIDQIIPEKKAVVAIKPRRAPAKNYGDNLYNAMVEQWNRYTYFLFRNGENLYSVDSEDFQVYDRLIPSHSDIEKLQKDVEEAKHWRRDPQEVYEKFNLRFYRFLMFLQGVLNTTDVLKPAPAGVNLLDENTYQNWVNVIYDDENVLTDGRPTYKEWVAGINSEVGVGSRIIYVPRNEPGYWERKSSRAYWGDKHLLRYYAGDYNMPELPEVGVYDVKGVEIGYEREQTIPIDGNKLNVLGFLYKDNRPRNWYDENLGERRRVTCLLLSTDEYINYDALTLEDVEYYLMNRIYRTQYLHIVPILLNARKQLRKEKAEEESFRNLLIYHSGRTDITPASVDEAISWWKFKNKYKRPISKDCTKAMRMIRKRLGIKTKEGDA